MVAPLVLTRLLLESLPRYMLTVTQQDLLAMFFATGTAVVLLLPAALTERRLRRSEASKTRDVDAGDDV